MNSTTIDQTDKLSALSQAETPALEFRHVSFSIDGVRILSDINFKLNPGTTLVITGEHESGKTILLKLAIGLFQPDEGEILINGQHIERLKESQLLALRASSIGLVFQESALFTSLTVYENTAFRLEEQKWEEEKIEVVVKEILKYVNLDDSMDKYWEELSVGMRRRLEIARALTGWPALMLFDEPTAGLDPINTKQILNLILGARDIHNVSSLYVTKELWEISYIDTHYAKQQADGSIIACEIDEKHHRETNVMVLKDGSISFMGKPQEFEMSDLPAVLNLTHPQGHLISSRD